MIQRETVEDGHRAVIFRNGRFSRLAGPGVVTLLKGIDTIQRIEDIRNRPLDFYLEDLYPQDLPISVTVNLWARFDPAAVAGADRKLLRDLMLLAPRERNQEVCAILRDALMRATRSLHDSNRTSQDASPFDRVFPIFPTSKLHDPMIESATEDLSPRLRLLGMIVDRSRPVRITRIEVPEADRQSFTRDRVAARLRQSFPSLSDTTLAQLVAAFEGQLPLHVQDIHVEGATAQLDTTTLGADGSATQIALTAGMAAPPPAGPPASEQGEHLSKSDLRVLKSVPPNSGGSKRAA